MIASDASPLISLAKTGKLYLLREIFERVLIEEEVKRETIDRGKEEGAPDALVIEDAAKEGWIEIEKNPTIKVSAIGEIVSYGILPCECWVW